MKTKSSAKKKSQDYEEFTSSDNMPVVSALKAYLKEHADLATLAKTTPLSSRMTKSEESRLPYKSTWTASLMNWYRFLMVGFIFTPQPEMRIAACVSAARVLV